MLAYMNDLDSLNFAPLLILPKDGSGFVIEKGESGAYLIAARGSCALTRYTASNSCNIFDITLAIGIVAL